MIIHNHGIYIRHFGEAMLIPGANQLDAVLAVSFKEALKNPLNKKLVDTNEIEIVEGGNSGSSSIGDLSATDAASLASDTFDLTLLEKWLDEEEAGKDRKTVVSAIENQIDDIKNPDPEKVVDPKQ